MIALYIVMFLKVRRRLRARENLSQQGSYTIDYKSEETAHTMRRAHEDVIFSIQPSAMGSNKDMIATPPLAANSSAFFSIWSHNDESVAADEEARRRRLSLKPRLRILHSSRLDKQTRHLFMLSMFPLTYILLWIAGVMNRFFELAGSSNEYLTAFQATTQLTGLANAGIYGWREYMVFWQRLKRRWSAQY